MVPRRPGRAAGQAPAAGSGAGLAIVAAVTICIPAYNAAAYLTAALESALAQTDAEAQVLVVDNASTDDTAEIALRFARLDSRVRLVVNDANLGMTGNFNRCLELAESTYVKFLCADDLLRPRCVERMRCVLERNPDVVLVGCARELISDTGEAMGRLNFASRDVRTPGRDTIRRCFFSGNDIGEPSAVMFRRADALRGFRAEYNQTVDLEMWFDLLEKGDFAFLAEPLCSIRVHAGQQTARNVQSGRVVADKQLLFREYAARPYLRSGLWNRLVWDGRMASSVAGAGLARREIEAPRVREVFFPRLFRWLLLPGAAVTAGLNYGGVSAAASPSATRATRRS